MRLTGPQIAAAISLVGMTRESLCKEAAIAKNTLIKILNNDTAAYRESTISKIRDILEAQGVEFLPSDGVRRKPVAIDILTGKEGLREFFNGVQEYANAHGGTIVQFGVDEKLFLNYLDKDFSDRYVSKMQEVSQSRGDLFVKAIICEGYDDVLAPSYNEYRTIQKEFFQAVPFYIYGDVFAIIDFTAVPPPQVTLIKSASVASAYRKQFEMFWQMAKPLGRQNL